MSGSPAVSPETQYPGPKKGCDRVVDLDNRDLGFGGIPGAQSFTGQVAQAGRHSRLRPTGRGRDGLRHRPPGSLPLPLPAQTPPQGGRRG